MARYGQLLLSGVALAFAPISLLHGQQQSRTESQASTLAAEAFNAVLAAKHMQAFLGGKAADATFDLKKSISVVESGLKLRSSDPRETDAQLVKFAKAERSRSEVFQCSGEPGKEVCSFVGRGPHLSITSATVLPDSTTVELLVDVFSPSTSKHNVVRGQVVKFVRGPSGRWNMSGFGSAIVY